MSSRKIVSIAMSIIDSEYEVLCDMKPDDLYDYLKYGYDKCKYITKDEVETLHKDFFG